MKIVVDARFTRLDHHDGISRYGASLIAAAARIADVSMLISDRRQLALLPDVPYTLINSPLSPSELFVAARVNKLGADVVVCPMQTMGSWGRKYALVLTLHDLIYYEHPEPPAFLPAPVRASVASVPQGVLAAAAPAEPGGRCRDHQFNNSGTHRQVPPHPASGPDCGERSPARPHAPGSGGGRGQDPALHGFVHAL